MIYLQKNDIHSTLTTWIYCHMWMLWVNELMGKECYIDWFKGSGSLRSYQDAEKFTEEPNMYNWFFVQPYFREDKTEVQTWETWVDDSGTGGLYAQPLQVIKDYYKKNLIFNDPVNARGNELVTKYGIDFSKTIGITWRGTDIYLDGRPRIPIERYYKWIDMALEQIPDARIMCTAEEETILDPLLARYPQAFRIEEFVSAPFGGKDNPERFSNMSGFERGLQPTLMVWLFSKCAWYIKNRSSTGAVASWLSNGEIVSIAHAETLNYDKFDNQDEYKGIRYDK